MASKEVKDEPVIVVGGGLAGLVAAYELTKAKQKVVIVDQEHEASLGGQAFWSLGGIFLVDSAEQRFMGVKDSKALAQSDWFNSAQFDRQEDEDIWSIKWANAYLDFAHHGMRQYLTSLGIGFLKVVGWAERGSGDSGRHGNSVPRFHIVWGAGPEVVRVFRDPVLKAAREGLVDFKYRHRVDEIIKDADGRAIGVRGATLEATTVARGVSSSRTVIGDFELHGKAVVIASGGIGANIELIKQMWPTDRLGGKVPDTFVVGVPAHVDGRLLKIAEGEGARIVNRDRMWHYTGRALQYYNLA
jgi:predicted oxidoreductase